MVLLTLHFSHQGLFILLAFPPRARQGQPALHLEADIIAERGSVPPININTKAHGWQGVLTATGSLIVFSQLIQLLQTLNYPPCFTSKLETWVHNNLAGVSGAGPCIGPFIGRRPALTRSTGAGSGRALWPTGTGRAFDLATDRCIFISYNSCTSYTIETRALRRHTIYNLMILP